MKSPGLERFIITYNNAHESNDLDKKKWTESKTKSKQRNIDRTHTHTHTYFDAPKKQLCTLPLINTEI